MAEDGESIDYCDAEDVFGDCNDLAMEGSFLDELLKATHACTHTHTCNPPGPSNAPHTHTCIHTHTHLFAQQQQQQQNEASSETLNCSKTSQGAEGINLDASEEAMDISAFLKKRPLGNREAVKKYREKKKAQTAYLEEQVAQLRSINQQLLRRLQGHAALEAEVHRLRTLLAEFRGRIDGELGVLYQKTPRVSQPLPGFQIILAKRQARTVARSREPEDGRRRKGTVTLICQILLEMHVWCRQEEKKRRGEFLMS
ncbi:hypothetical protein GOP47_0025576 [Adiantum capillus-veneris]|uniref:BZIP domain-containing protein n=1 Tax=Adiantum capillus-veneris TaxID=13818 RepID=A0A9D4Z3P0_ADICA|nr:hypothetical protein GOP47_0025576 [Adiantum capillus-veneris]